MSSGWGRCTKIASGERRGRKQWGWVPRGRGELLGGTKQVVPVIAWGISPMSPSVLLTVHTAACSCSDRASPMLGGGTRSAEEKKRNRGGG